MKLFFSNQASILFQNLKNTDPERTEAALRILRDMMEHPFEGLGEPVALEGEFSGLWQRRFGPADRIVYSVDADKVIVYAVGNAQEVHWDIGQSWR